MIGTYNGKPLLSCDWMHPVSGAFMARIEIEEEPAATGTLQLGSRTFKGVAVDSALRNGLWNFRFVAGNGAWGRVLPERFFAGPVKLEDVIRVTASTVGETVIVGASAAGEVPSYARPAGPARRVFGGASWYVGSDGITRVGIPREGTDWARESLLVRRHDDEGASGSGEEPPAPGDSALADEGTRVVFAATWGDLRGNFYANLDGVLPFAGAVRLAVSSTQADPGAREYAFASGLWSGVAPGSADVDASNVASWIFPGCAFEFAPDTRAIIGYADGDRTQPRILGATGDPIHVRFTAGAFAVGAAALPVAKAAEVIAAFAALASAFDAQASALTALGSVPVTSAALGTVLTALSASFKSLLDKIPTVTFTAE